MYGERKVQRGQGSRESGAYPTIITQTAYLILSDCANLCKYSVVARAVRAKYSANCDMNACPYILRKFVSFLVAFETDYWTAVE